VPPDVAIATEEVLLEERAALDLEVFPLKTFAFTSSNPLTVRLILTPDIYVEVVLDLLRRAPTRTFYFQTQSLNPVKDPSLAFCEMMQLLAKYSNDRRLDARFIFRNIGQPAKSSSRCSWRAST